MEENQRTFFSLAIKKIYSAGNFIQWLDNSMETQHVRKFYLRG